MQEGDIGVIVNPRSAGGRTAKALPRVTKALQALGAPFALVTTTGPLDAWRRAREFAEEGAERVIAVGGDGTFNEVVNGLMEASRPIPMGIVPAGTGCDLPRTLGINGKSVEKSVAFAATAGPRIIDVGHATCDSGVSRYFINVAGLGFDATIAERAPKTRLPNPTLAYVATTLASLVSFKKIPVQIRTDEAAIDVRAVFVTIANAQFFGGGFKITPMADISDGVLDLAIIGDVGRLELIANMPSVFRGKHTGHVKFTHMPITHARITSTEHALVQVDGEVIGQAPVEFIVRPSAFAIVA